MERKKESLIFGKYRQTEVQSIDLHSGKYLDNKAIILLEMKNFYPNGAFNVL